MMLSNGRYNKRDANDWENMMKKLIKLKKSNKAGYDYTWAVDFVNPPGQYDIFPLAVEFIEVRQFCEREFGPALEYELYCSLRAFGNPARFPPNPHWTYECAGSPSYRMMIFLRHDEDVEIIKRHFGVSDEKA